MTVAPISSSENNKLEKIIGVVIAFIVGGSLIAGYVQLGKKNIDAMILKYMGENNHIVIKGRREDYDVQVSLGLIRATIMTKSEGNIVEEKEMNLDDYDNMLCANTHKYTDCHMFGLRVVFLAFVILSGVLEVIALGFAIMRYCCPQKCCCNCFEEGIILETHFCFCSDSNTSLVICQIVIPAIGVIFEIIGLILFAYSKGSGDGQSPRTIINIFCAIRIAIIVVVIIVIAIVLYLKSRKKDSAGATNNSVEMGSRSE